MTKYQLINPQKFGRNLITVSRQEIKDDIIKDPITEKQFQWRSRQRIAIKKIRMRRPASTINQTTRTEKICNLIRNQDWKNLIPYVDELISQIEKGTISIASIAKLLNSTSQDYEIMAKNLFVHDVVKTISILLKDIMIFIISDNTDGALTHAKRIKKILETAHEISEMAKKEGFEPLTTSSIVQIDVIEGKPIYALK